MLITHALQTHKAQKGQTPKRKINRIVTAKNQLLNPSIKNLHKMNIDNKENQNPNIRKSPGPSQQKPNEHQFVSYPHQQRQTRIKSQYYKSGTSISPTAPKQSPIKKILFVKNLSYKSAKTSKNSSLDNKNQQPHQQSKYLSLGGGLHRDQSGKLPNNQRRSYSHYNSTKSFAQNESQIFCEHRLSEKPIQEFVSREMFVPNNQSQASYKMSPNELHTKMNKFNQNYVSQTLSQQLNKLNPQKLATFDYPSSFNSQSFHNKSIKMCPNIQSPDLSSLQSIKNNRYLYQNKKQRGTNADALIMMDKEKKESLSSKKRTSRIKINTKNSQKHRQSFNEEYNMTEESDFIVSSPSQPLFQENNSKLSNGQPQPTNYSKNGTKSTNSKQIPEQSTLVQTKKFDDTFENLNSELSKASQSESIHCEIHEIRFENPIQKHSVERNCWNHPQKQAKFKVNKQVQKPFYCSKCTVLLVTHGYKVIQNLQQKNDRLQKLKSFMFQLQMHGPKLKSSQLSISSLQEKVTNLQSQSTQQIQAYYTALIKCLQTHKQTAIKSLNYHSSKVLAELDQLRKKQQQNEQQIVFLKNDILPNVDLIVDQLRITPQIWKRIIAEHQEKMGHIQRVTDMISKVLNGQGDNKITIKSVQIPSNQLKSALNLLEQSQIVFKQKLLKLQPMSQAINRLHTSPTRMNQTKRSFSFDDQNIDTSFYVPSSKKKTNGQMSPQGVQNIYELTDSIRLSFGNRLDSNSGREGLKSPTFKAI